MEAVTGKSDMGIISFKRVFNYEKHAEETITALPFVLFVSFVVKKQLYTKYDA